MIRTIVIPFALTIVLSACSKAEEPKPEEKPAAPAAPAEPAPPAPTAPATAGADIAPEQADAVAAALEKEIDEDLAKE